MDLRIKKTKRAIRSAFYELIKEKPLEKITVREIAERAVDQQDYLLCTL